MDKLRMMSMDNVQMNVEKIQKLFPNAVTEVLRDGKPTLAIDFDVLKQELSAELIDDKEERYQFTWPDKKKSVLLANTPISAALRPCKEESVDFDHTQNLYIEGDNLDVLKLLQETYLGKIKMIYIDPPYNTGNDFVYNDDFRVESEEWSEMSGDYDEQGNRLVQNTESNGRFHTDWLNMIYPRLKIAKDLLADDGVIFISIDDKEQANLKEMCNEVFGENNFVNTFMWLHGKGKKDNHSRTLQQYVLCYAKNIGELAEWTDKSYTNYDFSNPDNDPKGKWFSGSLSFSESRSNPLHPFYYSITSPTGVKWTRQWQVPRDEMEALIANGDISWGNPVTCDGVPRQKIRPSVIEIIPPNIIDNCGSTAGAQNELIDLLGSDVFAYPKPVALINHLLALSTNKKDLILDFFSGSATTAHAVMQLNAEDGGNRKYIMVQLPEKCDEKSEAYKAGYKTICDIGKERIRRAGKKIKDENPSVTNLDVGFRVLKLDSSNMKDVYYKPSDYSQGFLGQLEDNIKADRTPLDLLFQVMLDLGKPLSAKIEEREIADKHVFVVDDNDLVACFDSNVTEDVVKTIAQLKPLYAVFRDSGLSSDSVGANFDQIFATYSPNTTRKVL